MKTALIILALFSAALGGLSGVMLSRADSTGQVVLWSILLVAHLLNCAYIGGALGRYNGN